MRTIFAAVLLLAIAGCSDPTPITPAACPPMPPESPYVWGTVKAPLRLLATAVDTPSSDETYSEGTVASAVVGLADALGHPLPGVVPAVTDAEGHYALGKLPLNKLFLVVAHFTARDGKEAVLSTMVRTHAPGATADLDLASTLVTTDVATAMEGFDGILDPDAYQAAVGLVRGRLTDATVPDLGSTESIAQRVAELKKDDAIAKALLALRLNLNPSSL